MQPRFHQDVVCFRKELTQFWHESGLWGRSQTFHFFEHWKIRCFSAFPYFQHFPIFSISLFQHSLFPIPKVQESRWEKKDVCLCLCVTHQPMTTSQNLTWDIMFKRQKHTVKPPWPLTAQISSSVNLSEHLYHLKGFSRGFFSDNTLMKQKNMFVTLISKF